jgi:hypothetical protein
MQNAMVDLHRSHLEALMAIEIEFKHRTTALSNRRISEIKKLLATTDELYANENDGSPLIESLGLTDPSIISSVAVDSQTATPKGSKKKKKHKKALPPAKPIKVASGKAPRLIDAIQMVMRNKKMKAQQIYEHLKSKGWLPNSKDPIGYIRFTLSSEGDIFQRVDGERGVYHLEPSNPYYSGKLGKLPHRRSTHESSEEAPNPSADETLESSPEEAPKTDPETPHKISIDESRALVEQVLNEEVPTD